MAGHARAGHEAGPGLEESGGEEVLDLDPRLPCRVGSVTSPRWPAGTGHVCISASIISLDRRSIRVLVPHLVWFDLNSRFSKNVSCSWNFARFASQGPLETAELRDFGEQGEVARAGERGRLVPVRPPAPRRASVVSHFCGSTCSMG